MQRWFVLVVIIAAALLDVTVVWSAVHMASDGAIFLSVCLFFTVVLICGMAFMLLALQNRVDRQTRYSSIAPVTSFGLAISDEEEDIFTQEEEHKNNEAEELF